MHLAFLITVLFCSVASANEAEITVEDDGASSTLALREWRSTGNAGNRNGRRRKRRRRKRTPDFTCVFGFSPGHVGTTTLNTAGNYAGVDHVMFNFEGAMRACVRACVRAFRSP